MHLVIHSWLLFKFIKLFIFLAIVFGLGAGVATILVWRWAIRKFTSC